MVTLSELWKPVVDFEGFYEVSNLGKVRSLDRTIRFKNPQGVMADRRYKGKMCNPSLSHYGYPEVGLSKNNRTIVRRVHTLVAAAFLGLCPKGMEVNHKDGIKTNACLSNLEYITHRENILHSIATGLKTHTNQGLSNGNAKLTESDVFRIRAEAKNRTVAELAREYGLSYTGAESIIKRRTWKYLP